MTTDPCGYPAGTAGSQCTLRGLALAAAVVLVAPFVVFAFSDGPAPGHSGGFDEPTCHSCHFDNSPDDGSGTLALVGLPEVYTPGASYRLEVTLERADLERVAFGSRLALLPEGKVEISRAASSASMIGPRC